MQAPNRKKQAPKVRPSREARIEKKQKGLLTVLHMIAKAFTLKGGDENAANRKAAHYAYFGGGSPEYTPRQHSRMSYANQQRNATKRRNIRMHPAGAR